MKLKCDVYSLVGKGKIYGYSGDEVKIISDKGNVLVVEDSKGNRFPVSIDEVTTSEVQSKEKPFTETKPITHHGAAKARQKRVAAPLNNQKELF